MLDFSRRHQRGAFCSVFGVRSVRMAFDLSVVVPAHNEHGSIGLFVEAANAFLRDVDYAIQFVFIDDGSTDDTHQLLLDIHFEKASCKVVKLSRNFGSHAAIRAGIMHSDADKVAVYSMDMPEPIGDLTLFYRELEAGTELVYSERIGYRGSFGSRVFGKMVTKDIEETYPTGGLIGIAFGPKIKEQLNARPEKNSSIFFQVFQLGFSTKSIPVQYTERQAGESKWTFAKKIKLFIDSFVMFSFTPIRVISGIGSILAIIGIVWAIAIVLFKLTGVVHLSA